MADYDAIIIGSGHNGLACACYLARAGWRVVVLEAAKELGGALRSGAVTLPGFIHDRYASNVGAFVASPVYRDLKAEFDNFGLRLLRSDRAYASVYSQRALRVYTDRQRTEEEFGAIHKSDAAGWRRLTDFYSRTAPRFLPLFATELPSAAMLEQMWRVAAGGMADAVRLAQLVRQTSRNFARGFMGSPEAQGLLEAWGYHLDFGPNVPGGALFAFVFALSAHIHGMSIVEGGTGRIAAALQTMIEQAGGYLMTDAEVTNVVVARGRAVAVRTAKLEITAKHAIVANVTIRNLFGKLLAPEVLPSSFRSRAANFRYGAGTFVVHLALDRLPTWKAADDLTGFSYLHLNSSEGEIEDTYRQCSKGFLPARPLLIVSQTTPIDPSRAPPGKHVMRVHVRTVPADIRGDGAGTISANNWNDAKAAFTERIIDLVEKHAPDLRSCIIAVAAETPEDVERENPNFIGGDCGSGSHQFGQNFLLRPLAGWSRYATPIAQLYMIGASTWPGAGLNAGSGYLVARKLIHQLPLFS